MWELDHKGCAPKNRCFWPVVLEKTLESPLDFEETNQSLLKEINPEYSLEGLMVMVKLQSFGHLMPRADSLEKTLMLAKIEGKRRRWQRMRRLDPITNSMDMNLSKLWVSRGQRSLVCCSPWGCKESDKALRLNSNKLQSHIPSDPGFPDIQEFILQKHS